MQLSDIRKSLFGYKKDDVYKYFAELSSDFSERLRKSEEELSKKNAELEERLAEYQAKEAAIVEQLEKMLSDLTGTGTDTVVTEQMNNSQDEEPLSLFQLKKE